jgi:hypothetical protein
MSPDEVGAMDFPFVVELLKYWADYPPTHLLLRAMAHYEGSNDRSNWRSRRAQEMGDETYVPKKPSQSDEDRRMAMTSFAGDGKHLDCAPIHIQEAVARFKRGEHLSIPKSE